MHRHLLSAAWIIITFAGLLWLFTAYGADFEQIAQDNIAFGVALGLALLVASQVAAPLTGFPVFAIIAKLYGLPIAAGTLYAAYVLSSAINFQIARRLGAPVVECILGPGTAKRALGWLDNRSSVYVSLTRVLGYYYHDIFSYAWGLTSVSFTRYYVTTLIATLIPVGVEYLVLSRIPLDDVRGLIYFYVAMIAVTIAFLAAWFVFMLVRRRSASTPPPGPSVSRAH